MANHLLANRARSAKCGRKQSVVAFDFCFARIIASVAFTRSLRPESQRQTPHYQSFVICHNKTPNWNRKECQEILHSIVLPPAWRHQRLRLYGSFLSINVLRLSDLSFHTFFVNRSGTLNAFLFSQ